MKKFLLSIATLVAGLSTAMAVSNNTVEIVYNGTSATVTVATNIAKYITVSSGTSSHVVILQDSTFAGINPTTSNTSGEIIYSLKGTSANGSFTTSGAFKCTVELNGLTLTNPTGPAINIQNGKRTSVSAKNGTTNTLTDGANDLYNGCFHSKGHTKFKGKGTLNIVGKSRHGIYSKEYVEIKNLTLNITAAVKDGIHCKEYFLMESGTLTISGTGDDGIQVELGGLTSTGTTTDHEDEDSGCFYMTGGTLTISNYVGSAVKADGTIDFTGGKQNFNTADVIINADVQAIGIDNTTAEAVYDLNGRLLPANAATRRGIYLVKTAQGTRKVVK